MKPILYIKQGCPWCIDALDYFKRKKLDLDVRDVRGSAEGMAELEEVSGQSLTPTLVHGNFLVADFDIDEFEAALDGNPTARKELGIEIPNRSFCLLEKLHNEAWLGSCLLKVTAELLQTS